MGLDMYVYIVNKRINSQKELEEFLQKPDCESKKIQYFRKHSDLHGYFQELFYQRSTKDTEFNCEPLLLTEYDIKDLQIKVERHLKGEKVFEKARGFFWGESIREDWGKTLEMCIHILNTVDFEHQTVYYYSWW